MTPAEIARIRSLQKQREREFAEIQIRRKIPVVVQRNIGERFGALILVGCVVAWAALSVLVALGLNWMWVKFHIPLPVGSYVWLHSRYTFMDVILASMIALSLFSIVVLFPYKETSSLIQFSPEKPSLSPFRLMAEIGGVLTFLCLIAWFSLWVGGYAIFNKESLYYKPTLRVVQQRALSDVCAIFFLNGPGLKVPMQVELHFLSGEKINLSWVDKSAVSQLARQVRLPLQDWKYWEAEREKHSHAICSRP